MEVIPTEAKCCSVVIGCHLQSDNQTTVDVIIISLSLSEWMGTVFEATSTLCHRKQFTLIK